MNKKSVIKNCLKCGKEMKVKHSLINRKKYCSKKCLYSDKNKRKFVKCLVCGKVVRRKGVTKYCSVKCFGIGHRKEKSNLWKGGIKRTHGYILLYKPEYESSNKQGYINEHRFVMEQYLGRRLDKSEEVHHINHIKTDNRIENLQVISKKEHSAYIVNVCCPNCHTVFCANTNKVIHNF